MPISILYHNPRCSKSRQALQFLSDETPDLQIHEYLKNPLNKAQLTSLYNKLVSAGGISSAHEMVRVKEAEYKLASLSKASHDNEVLDAIAQHPKLLERPIYETDTKAAIGRPLENIQAIVND